MTHITPGEGSKPTNPKDAIGSNKLPIHLWPASATALGSLALLDGALKYGRSNFRAVGVRASIYNDALRRHMDAWFEGEDDDAKSGLPHLGHALACLAILVDAQAAGKLNDDRMFPGRHREFVDGLEHHVARLKNLHARHAVPEHYTRQDTPVPVPAPSPSPPRKPTTKEFEEAYRQWHRQQSLPICSRKTCSNPTSCGPLGLCLEQHFAPYFQPGQR